MVAARAALTLLIGILVDRVTPAEIQSTDPGLPT